MGMEIYIGDVRIVDVNQNDELDIGTDQITDTKGLPLPSRTLQRRLDGLLQDLQAKNWKGIPLEEASRYLQSFRKAAEMARKGHVMGMELALQSAMRFSNHLPVVFNGKRADDIKKLGLIKGIEFRLQQVEEEIKTTGNISSVKMLLNFAKEYSDELQQFFNTSGGYSQKKADQLLKKAYLQGIPLFYQRIDQKAAAGELVTVKGLFLELSFYLTDAKTDFGLDMARSPKIDKQTLKLAYQRGIPRQYTLAEDEALEGEVGMVELRLEALKKLIQEANTQFSLNISFDAGKAQKILHRGFETLMKKYLKQARAAAREGKIQETQRNLAEAQWTAQQYNQKYAGKKSKNSLIFDTNLAAEIEDCARGLGPCPVP